MNIKFLTLDDEAERWLLLFDENEEDDDDE